MLLSQLRYNLIFWNTLWQNNADCKTVVIQSNYITSQELLVHDRHLCWMGGKLVMTAWDYPEILVTESTATLFRWNTSVILQDKSVWAFTTLTAGLSALGASPGITTSRWARQCTLLVTHNSWATWVIYRCETVKQKNFYYEKKKHNHLGMEFLDQ